MARYRITVTEFSDIDLGSTEKPKMITTETEVFKLVVDQFDPASFTRAVTAQPRKRRKVKAQETA